MRLSELIEMLEDYQEQLEGTKNDDPEILIMHQENYPLIIDINGVCTQREIEVESAMQDGEKPEEEDLSSVKPAVYLVGGTSPYKRNPYGHKIAWEMARG